jgi:hypothetical protein
MGTVAAAQQQLSKAQVRTPQQLAQQGASCAEQWHQTAKNRVASHVTIHVTIQAQSAACCSVVTDFT